MIQEKERLIQLMAEKSLRLGSLKLSSGKPSKKYVDAKMVCQDPEVAPFIADAFKDFMGDTEVDAVGGPEIGAVPINGALSAKGYYRTFFIRKEPKKHGLEKWIEGPLKPEDRRVVIIDDVATTGISIRKAINSLKRQYPKIEIVRVIVLVDREEGASELLKEDGYKLESILTLKDLISQRKKKNRCQQAA